MTAILPLSAAVGHNLRRTKRDQHELRRKEIRRLLDPFAEPPIK